jgi:hypothetical protein
MWPSTHGRRRGIEAEPLVACRNVATSCQQHAFQTVEARGFVDVRQPVRPPDGRISPEILDSDRGVRQRRGGESEEAHGTAWAKVGSHHVVGVAWRCGRPTLRFSSPGVADVLRAETVE